METKKPLADMSFEEYATLLQSGMMYEYYPECTGSFTKDTAGVDKKPVDDGYYEPEDGC